MASKTLFLILTLSLVSSIEVTKFELSKGNKNLIEAFKAIRSFLIKKSSAKRFNLMSIHDPDHKDVHEAVKDEIIKNAFDMESIRMCDIDFLIPGLTRYSVLLVDNIEAFRDVEEQIVIDNFQKAIFPIVILLNGNFTDVHEIFTSFWFKTIYNIMALINLNGTMLLSFEPYEDPMNCGHTTPKVINKFQDGKFLKKLTLIKKFNNLNLCPITVTTFVNAVAVWKQMQPDGFFKINGYEINMINTIAEMLNFTLDLKFRDGIQQWGVIYENGTCTRGFADLKESKTDVAMGNLFLRESRIKYFDSSAPYMNYPVFFVLSPEKKFNKFEKLLNPFKAPVWITLLMTFWFGVGVILVISLKFKLLRSFVYGDGVNHPITNLFLVFIGSPLPVLPKNNFARFILMMISILCLIIRSLYQGSLYKFLQSDGRHKEPQTIAELVEKEYTFIMSESNMDLIYKYRSKVHIATKPADGYIDMDLDEFAGTTERTATFGSKVDLMQYSLDHNNFPYKVCKESFFTINIVLFYNKNFFLKESIDDAIQRILTYGFMEHWGMKLRISYNSQRYKIFSQVFFLNCSYQVFRS
ncbi:hypothetical protein ACKWTF_008994 [Chironomus riparius]